LIPENELTKAAGIVMSAKTGGPEVNEFYQTSHSSVFACGNVLHVTGLVDDVTTESENAGRFAALYAMGQSLTGGQE
jgi:NAD(P)H-nitrite reductase large subunit